MAGADAGARAARRLSAGKRLMSCDILPDVTNLPDVRQKGKTSRGDLVSNKNTSFTSTTERQVESGHSILTLNQSENVVPSNRHGNKTCGVQENQYQPPARAAKTAAKAKLKAIITPFGRNRKKKEVFKVPALSESVSSSLNEEPMEVDNPASSMGALDVSVPLCVADIDDHNDFFLSPEYAQDIVHYMRSRERQLQLPPGYLSKNPEVTSQMRGILVDWLIQVQAHEQLEEETLQLSVAITDQYLARAVVPLHQLQLLGITCLLLAAKFIERFPPLIGNLCALTASTYTDNELLKMEITVLCELKFELSVPLPHFFLQRFLMVHEYDVQVERLAKFLIDLAMPSIHMVPVVPSMQAASALYVARQVWLPEDLAGWSQGLIYYSGYSLNQLLPVVRMMAKMLLRTAVSKYQGARQKHAGERKYGAISLDPMLENNPALLRLAKETH